MKSVVCLVVYLSLLATLMGRNVLADEQTHIPQSAYTVQSGDILRVSVWDEPELQADVVVLPDQTISFPLVGLINVSNKSLSEITELLTEKLSKFIPEAHVNIAIQQVRGSKFYVLGKVNRPGQFPLEGKTRVLQALSVAGGLSTFADEDGVKVVRDGDGGQVSINVSYPKLLKGKDLSSNVEIKPGDVVVVP